MKYEANLYRIDSTRPRGRRRRCREPGFRRAVAGFAISPLSETLLPGGGQTKADEGTMETVFDVISFYMDAPLTGIAGGAATSFSPLPEKHPFYPPKTHPPYR